jgi:hypothetical protein
MAAYTLYPALQQPIPVNSDVPFSQESAWHKAWAEPNLGVRVVAAAAIARIASGQQLDPFWRPTPEFVGPDKWWQPFSERLYAKPRLHASLNPFLAYSESAQFPETTQLDKYLYPFSIPVRYPKRLIAAANPASTTGAHALGNQFSRAYVIC